MTHSTHRKNEKIERKSAKRLRAIQKLIGYISFLVVTLTWSHIAKRRMTAWSCNTDLLSSQ